LVKNLGPSRRHTQRATEYVLDHHTNAPRAANAHFGFRRMDIHVDPDGIEIEKKDDRRMAVEVKRLRSAIRGVSENPVAHQASIDEKELIAAAPVANAASHVSRCARRVVGLVDFGEIRLRVVAEDLNDAIAE